MPDPDILYPALIGVVCLALMGLSVWLTREKTPAWGLPQPDAPPTAEVEVPIELLAGWHRTHGPIVRRWIENHESVLDRISEDGLKVDLTDASLTGEHERLAGTINQAIQEHPAPPMRAQLSAMVVAGEATIYAVRRSEYGVAERQHLTYLEYRDQWLHRLRQFSAGDTDIRNLRTIADQHRDEHQLRPRITG